MTTEGIPDQFFEDFRSYVRASEEVHGDVYAVAICWPRYDVPPSERDDSGPFMYSKHISDSPEQLLVVAELLKKAYEGSQDKHMEYVLTGRFE